MTDAVPIEPQHVTWRVDGLGPIKGWQNTDGSIQFFGVPFATIPARFRHSSLRDTWEGAVCDATSLRGYCPQPHRAFYPFLVPDRPNAGTMKIDEFESLNLQITVPAGTRPSDKVPVLVYVHGGAFVFGTGDYSILDGKALAKQSVELGLPTVIVSINYRCGFFGFLCSSDIAADAEGQNGNFGLQDQKNAFVWINKYIDSFGGDPTRITVAGQSAGAASMDVHLRAPHSNLFSSVILLSGTAPICGIYTIEEYEVLYFKLLHVLGISKDLPGTERLARLRAVSHEEISRATYIVFQDLDLPQFGISTDVTVFGDTFKLPKPSDYPHIKLNFAGRLMIGDCLHEGIIYNQAYMSLTSDDVIPVIRKHVPSAFVDQYLHHYGIEPGMSPKEVFPCIESLLTDCMFTGPPYFIAEANPEIVWAYHFNHISRFDNAWGGYAHHSLDYMFVFGNISQRQNPAERELSHIMAKDYLTFASGQAPYPSYGQEKKSRTYGQEGKHDIVQGGAKAKRPVEWFEEIKPYMNELFDLAADINVRQTELLSEAYGPGSTNVREIPQLLDHNPSIV